MDSMLVTRAKVYPNFGSCSIQTFNDQNKEDKSFSKILPMTRSNLERCEKLQSTQPYGVFFSVNPMESGKRNKESVQKIQTWICDIDTGTKEEQLDLIWKATLQPSLVVESVHGFHLYYLADKDLTEEEFENGNFGLRNYYNGDIKVCRDTARVLRIPGFYHQKGEKIMVVYRADLSSREAYSMELMTNAFPNQTETTPGIEKQRKEYNKHLDEEDSFWRKASELSSKEMLETFSGSQWVNYDNITFKRNTSGTEQIYVNGKSTGCWIDKNGFIGSGDGGGPTWIQWLKWYGVVDRKELAKELKRIHPELDEDKKKVVKLDLDKLMSSPEGAPVLKKPDFTWGDKGLDDAIGKLSKKQMVILIGETGAGKTTFATFIARKNKNSCYFVLEDSVDNIARRYALKWAGITKSELNNGTWGDYKQELFERAYLRFRSKDIKFVDVGHKLTIETLIELMRELKAKGHEMFFIDNLGYVIGNGVSEAEQTADISSKLVSFCLEEDVCVVLLHHFKKGDSLKSRDIGQMRGSGKLGDDAFLVANYRREDEGTLLEVYKDRQWGELEIYELEYDRGDFVYKRTL